MHDGRAHVALPLPPRVDGILAAVRCLMETPCGFERFVVRLVAVLDADTYMEPMVRAWNAIVEKAVHPNGFLGYMQGTGKDPSAGQPVTYDSVPDFEDYGLGCVLLATGTNHLSITSNHRPRITEAAPSEMSGAAFFIVEII